MKSLHFLNIIFAKLSGGKSVKSLNLVLIPGGKFDGHRGTWAGCLQRVNKEDSDSPHSLLVFLG